MKKILGVIFLLLLLVVAVISYNTIRFQSRQISVSTVARIPLQESEIATRLSGALRFRTVSDQNTANRPVQEFQGFHRYLADSFPALHEVLPRETVAGLSLLYEWKGRSNSSAPVVLMAHMDVVPAVQEEWQHPPFDGTIADDYIWGRGALDDKSNLMAILEAVEYLVRQGMRPSRTIFLAFGHDEEVAGTGAEEIMQVLAKRGMHPDFVMDEGLSIITGMVPGIERPVASIGIAEKGYLTVELTTRSKGGHSSVPPPHTSIGVLSRAIQQLEDNPLPAQLDGVPLQTIEYLGPEFPLSRKAIMANLWLTKPLVESAMAYTDAGNAMLRTTTAVTMVEGGIKENVLPAEAKAFVNFRIRPGQTMKDVENYVAKVVDTNQVEINVPRKGSNPSPVSSTNSPQFELLGRTIRQVFPNVIVAPGLLMGATDSRHFTKLTPSVYRFSPFVLGPEDIELFHAKNERISIASYGDMVRFYVQLIRNYAFDSDTAASEGMARSLPLLML